MSGGSPDDSDAQGAPTGRAGDRGANGADDDGSNAADDARAEPARVHDQTPLTASQVDVVHQSQTSPAALELAIEGLRSAGQLQAARAVELELQKENRQRRALIAESPAVADTFLQRRKVCLLYTSPSPRDRSLSRMPSSA